MKLKRINHVGVIVASLENARQLIEGSFGLEAIRHIKRDDLEATFFKCGGADIELIEIKDAAMREQRLGSGREARVEHIAFEVENLTEILAALEGLGIKTTGPPQVTPAYTTVWTDAHTSGDVMYQFMELAPDQTAE